MKLQGATTPRPMTHDLLSEMLGELDVNCTRVAVTELRENTFYASITLSVNGRELEIDSRPSDALALAVRSGAPIFAAEDVIAESAIEFEHEVEDTEEVVEKFKDFLEKVTPEDFAGREAARRVLTPRRAGSRARASSTIRPTSSSKPMPAASAACGQQAGLGQAGDRVGLEHVELARRLLEHQVDAREAVAAEQPVDLERELLRALGDARRAARPGRRSRCARSRSGPRSRRSPPRAGRPRRPAARPGRRRLEHRDGEVAAVRRGARAAPCGRRRTRRRARPGRRPRCAANLIPSAEPWPAGLTTIGKSRRSSIAGQRAGARRAP